MRLEEVLGVLWAAGFRGTQADDGCEDDAEEDRGEDADADYEGRRHGEGGLVVGVLRGGRVAGKELGLVKLDRRHRDGRRMGG